MAPKLDSVKCVPVGVSQRLVLVRENQLPKMEGDIKLKEGTGTPECRVLLMDSQAFMA